MKLFSKPCERNQVPILKVLTQILPVQASILEIASGTGQHANYFCTNMPEWNWQPSDISEENIESIKAYKDSSKKNNFLNPILLSTQDESWDLSTYDAALCCNMIHISPWESCLGLFQNLSKHLVKNGDLLLYGPFFQDNVETAESNLAFNRSLQERDSRWGIRHLKDICSVSNNNGFIMKKIYEMPANNLLVSFKKL